nr:hypothetical protein [uncultured Albidiferax sp.]
MRKLIQSLPRPRIQRAFVVWLRENRARFAVPVRLTKVKATGILLHFTNQPECLFVWLSRGDLSVYVEWQGLTWDMLISLDAEPVLTAEGYRCSFCEVSDTTWPTREALWTEHLFEPFLEWVNACLAGASSIRFFGTRDTFTCAELSNRHTLSPVENCIAEVPLFLESRQS